MKRNNLIWRMLAALLLCSAAFAATAAEIKNAWVRATVPGQEVGAAYMELSSPTDTRLVKVESPAAGSVEIHSMTMKNGAMQMRMLETLALPAGKLVKLAPGGFHLMLFDLKQPLQAGENVSFTLFFRDAQGKTEQARVKAPVRNSQE